VQRTGREPRRRGYTIGSAAFGTFDTLTVTSYDTVSHFFATIPGGSGAQVTIGGAPASDLGQFQPVTAPGASGDDPFYQGRNQATNVAIVTTAQATSVSGVASPIIALPDGTVMTLAGVTTSELAQANGFGLLFK
jgi:hypothetical protein